MVSFREGLACAKIWKLEGNDELKGKSRGKEERACSRSSSILSLNLVSFKGFGHLADHKMGRVGPSQGHTCRIGHLWALRGWGGGLSSG